MNSALPVALLLFSLGHFAGALTLAEETDYSGSERAQTIYADDDFGPHAADKEPPYSWILGYGYQRTSTVDPGAANIVDTTQSVSGGLGWSGDSDFGLFGKLSYARTPEEKLSVEGAQLASTYHLVYAAAGASGFSPYLHFKLIGAANAYAQTYTGTTRRKKKTVAVTGNNHLRQEMLGLDVAWKPVRRWRFDLEYDQYIFNRNVANFEANLDSAAAIQRGASGFSNTVGVLARSNTTAAVSWEFVKDWRFNVSEMYARLAADNSVSTALKITLSDQINENWKVTIGFERLESNVFSDSLGLLGVEYAN